MTYFAKLWYHVSTCLYVCVRCGLILKDFKLFQATHAGHIHPGTLNCMQKTTTANIRHTILYLMHLTASSLLHVVSKACSIDNMKAPIRPYQFMGTGYWTYWHLSSSDGVSVPPTWGLTGWPCYVSTIALLLCFFLAYPSDTMKRHAHTPRNRPARSVSESWILLVGVPWVSQLVTLWLWTSSILTLATCFMYREASVLGLESWREKQRAPWCQCFIPVGPCVPLPIGQIATCSNVAGWSSVKLWLHATPKGGGKLSGGEVVKVPLSLTFPCLTVCWSWHFPRQQEQTSCRWLLIAITGGASWVRALAGNLDVAMDG